MSRSQAGPVLAAVRAAKRAVAAADLTSLEGIAETLAGAELALRARLVAAVAVPERAAWAELDTELRQLQGLLQNGLEICAVGMETTQGRTGSAGRSMPSIRYLG